MARYRLHCVGASGNSFKVALFLNCAGLDWEPVGVDFAGGETRSPDWRATTNVMGEGPLRRGRRPVYEPVGRDPAVARRNSRRVRSDAPRDIRDGALVAIRQPQIHRELCAAPVSTLLHAGARPASAPSLICARGPRAHYRSSTDISPTGASCWATGRRSSISRCSAICTIRGRRQVLILPRPFRPLMPGAGASPNCRAGSRLTR